MKKKILAVSFLLFIFWYGTALSKECRYAVAGTVTTIPLTELIQKGTIHLQLYDGENKVFDETGILIGIITESYDNGCRLTHMAIFEDGSMFVTNDDIACITDLVYDSEGNPLVDENLQPCAFQTTELMTKIVIAKGFFKKISEVDVEAKGIVDNCNKRNEFELSGYLLFK